jgi:acetoin utilization protein AcuB
MKIKSLMIPNPITISAHASISDALERMKANFIRHLPVVSRDNGLLGFLTLADLKQGLIPSMLGDLKLSDIMIKNPITVSPEDDIERAAQLIYKKKISGMPVVSHQKVVGIITESDILRAFIDMMGILSSSSRIDAVIGSDPGAFKKAVQIINDNGGAIISVGMTAHDDCQKAYYFRLSTCDTAVIRAALEQEGIEVLAAMD